MRTPLCIATDLDRTLTREDLSLDDRALARIDTLRAAGVRIVVATGRQLDELLDMRLDTKCDALVAENGGVIHRNGRTEIRDTAFAARAREALGEAGAALRWGTTLGSGPRADATAASARLHARGVAHSLEGNADEAMLLPPGISKASGLDPCIRALGLTPSECWAIGDGDNDVSMLRWAHVGAAPANASPAARAAATRQLTRAYAEGFLEMTDVLVEGRADGGAALGARGVTP